MTTTHAKPQHEDRDSSGRYRKSTPCDCCGKPVGTDPLCDDEVCGGTDGPGFYICERKRCAEKRATMTAEQRAAHYLAMRKAADPTDCYVTGCYWDDGTWRRRSA